MNTITILVWITIAIIGIISIIAVKLHYKGEELENDEGSILPNRDSIDDVIFKGSEKLNNNDSSKNTTQSLSPQTNQQKSLFRNKDDAQNNDNTYIVHEVENNNLKNFEYETQNQVLVNYDNTIEKTQEPIKQSQMDIMTQNKFNKNEDTSELKDLFTIDELIKESKRKDSERIKESQKIEREEDKAEIDNLKKSIKNKTEEPLIEDILKKDKEETINDLIKENDSENKTSDIPSVSTQKEIKSITTTESKESIPEDKSTPTTLTNTQTTEEIAEPALKTPSKVGENKDYKLGASIDDANIFNEEGEAEEEGMDLDYRKDIDRFTNKIKGSKIFKEVKGKLSHESGEYPPQQYPPQQQETYIRNVNDYDEYEPIINETHMDIEATYDEYHDERLRHENTKKVFNMAKNSQSAKAPTQLGTIKSKPARNNIKIKLNNNEVVLKKGDEIIFNFKGETYSSQVYAINGDDISVKYRRKNIKIKPSDVKKIY